MKNNIIILIAVFLLGISFQATAQSESMDAFTVQVDGLGCPFCAYGLEKKFKELKGIKQVKIAMETGIMDFTYPAEKDLSIERVSQQVEKAGYTPVSVYIKRGDGRIEKSEQKEAPVLAADDIQNIEIFVAGNCGMCKARIEKTAMKLDGVQSAVWDQETKQLTISASSGLKKADLEKAIAKAGHDTKNAKAKTATYNSLPGCCHYERVQ